MTKVAISVAAFAALLSANLATAPARSYPKAKVSYEDFKGLVAAVEKHRGTRLVNLNTFLEMSKRPNVVIFDSRSTFRYERIHLKGARHLAFTDFTQENLGKVIPSSDTTILIYCNNNFEGNQTDFPTKIAGPDQRSTTQMTEQVKPKMMALNVPTYITLYGYGYRNIYELDELVSVKDPRIAFEGSIAARADAFLPPR